MFGPRGASVLSFAAMGRRSDIVFATTLSQNAREESATPHWLRRRHVTALEAVTVIFIHIDVFYTHNVYKHIKA